MADPKYDYLIIGGGITGVTAAETIREKSATATIAVISDEAYSLYSRVLIPSFLKKRISRDQLFLRRAEDFSARGIDLYLSQTAKALDPKRRAVILESGLTFRYKKLLISSGGRVKPWGKKEDQNFIFRLQTLDDAERLLAALSGIRRPLVIGSSFIGLEFLEIFFMNEISSMVLSRDAHFFGEILDPEGGELMQNNFERHGIRTIFKDTVRETKPIGKELSMMTEKGESLESDALCLGIGLERNIEFLQGSGVELGAIGVCTDEFLRTNVPDIYAAGDVAEYFDVIVGRQRINGNWTSAFLQGKRAGLNMVGSAEPFKSVPVYSITNLGFQITALGDCSPAENVVRIDGPNDQYSRLFLRNGILVGAVLINRFQDRPHLAKLIEAKTPVSGYLDKLPDFTFDIRSIAPLR